MEKTVKDRCWNLTYSSELRSCVKVEVDAAVGSLSLIVISVDVKQQ